MCTQVHAPCFSFSASARHWTPFGHHDCKSTCYLWCFLRTLCEDHRFHYVFSWTLKFSQMTSVVNESLGLTVSHGQPCLFMILVLAGRWRWPLFSSQWRTEGTFLPHAFDLVNVQTGMTLNGPGCCVVGHFPGSTSLNPGEMGSHHNQCLLLLDHNPDWPSSQAKSIFFLLNGVTINPCKIRL